MTPAETTGSDAELIGLARSGDDAAYSALVARHRDAAMDMAAQRTGWVTDRADDVVAAAVSRMRDTLRAGFGPVEAFRPYLLTLVCHLSHASDLDEACQAPGLVEGSFFDFQAAMSVVAPWFTQAEYASSGAR